MMLSRYVVSQVKHNSYFLLGLSLGLWLSLSVGPLDEGAGERAACATSAAGGAPDEFEPHREERPLRAAPPAADRAVMRPRYYTTELGMRGSLFTGVLSSEEALKSQIAALNHTTARLQPAMKFFITASAMSLVPGLANVVGFTDTREMLKPFHALKYLADNYLEEYDFFFLVSDTTFVNARRLTELVSQLSVSQDLYMGTTSEDDSHYCSLEGGVLLSNSVLRAVHSELDWCVRNSYSPHHHENVGRCILHAARLSCTSTLQGETYRAAAAASAEEPPALREALADAVTVHPVTSPRVFYQLHAYVSRVYLERDRGEVLRWRGYLWRNAARHPPGYRNGTWPGGLRADPGLAPALPDTRFDHLRWVSFNGSHAFFPDDHHEVALITGATKEALHLVLEGAYAWAAERWRDARSVQLVEGAWRWEPPVALRYRLLLRLSEGPEEGGAHRLRLVEAVRALGAARLVPVRYVTEGARVWLTLAVRADRPLQLAEAHEFLQRYEAVCLTQDKNTALLLVVLSSANDTALAEPLRAAAAALGAQYGGTLRVLEAPAEPHADELPEHDELQESARLGLHAALGDLPRDALVVLVVAHAHFNQDFLNRVRMNTIAGEQWFLPAGFARYALYAHPRFVAPDGGKPQTNTGRFNVRAALVLSFYRADYDSALAEWRGPRATFPAAMLARSPLRVVRAPEPALVLQPRRAPCAHLADAAAGPSACARALRDQAFGTLDLGARHSLAQLLLETQADLEP